MIKPIEWQKPARITIMKDGNMVADLYVPGVNGGIDTDKAKMVTKTDMINDNIIIRLEV